LKYEGKKKKTKKRGRPRAGEPVAGVAADQRDLKKGMRKGRKKISERLAVPARRSCSGFGGKKKDSGGRKKGRKKGGGRTHARKNNETFVAGPRHPRPTKKKKNQNL